MNKNEVYEEALIEFMYLKNDLLEEIDIHGYFDESDEKILRESLENDTCDDNELIWGKITDSYCAYCAIYNHNCNDCTYMENGHKICSVKPDNTFGRIINEVQEYFDGFNVWNDFCVYCYDIIEEMIHENLSS